MTAHLEVMMKFRDLQVAEDFAKMAEMGYMDKEFILYGTAYAENGQRWYFISDKQAKVDTFSIAVTQKGCFPTPVMALVRTCPVPLGQEEKIVQ